MNPLQRDKRGVEGESDAGQPSSAGATGLPKASEMKMAKMLDHANNRLQALVQILYLLSRDTAVPQDARAHVTVAQGEIELLVRAMRRSAEKLHAKTDPQARSALNLFGTAHS